MDSQILNFNVGESIDLQIPRVRCMGPCTSNKRWSMYVCMLCTGMQHLLLKLLQEPQQEHAFLTCMRVPQMESGC